MKGIREYFQQGVGIGAGGSWFVDSKSSCCRMEQPEEFFEESSDEEVQVVLPAVQVDPLNVEVAEIPDNPESPSPQPSPVSPHPSPALQHSPLVGGPPVPPPPSSPREDSSSFMNFYTYDDLSELEQWTVDARAARRDPAARIEEPEVSYNMKNFLIYVYGRQWEIKLLRESGEVLIEQLKAYLAGYNQLTSFNRRQWLRLFPAWTAQERRDQLETLAEAGGFLVI